MKKISKQFAQKPQTVAAYAYRFTCICRTCANCTGPSQVATLQASASTVYETVRKVNNS